MSGSVEQADNSLRKVDFLQTLAETGLFANFIMSRLY